MSDTLEVGLIGHWRFQNVDLSDLSGNGRTLIPVGTVNFVEDKDGIANNAVSFAGTGNSLECAYSDSPQNPYISAWVKCGTPNAGYEFLVAIRGIERFWQGFTLLLEDGRVGWGTLLGNQQILQGIHNIQDGNWHHALLQYEKSTGILRLYVDGILRGRHAVYLNASITYNTSVNKIQFGTASVYPYESNDMLDEVMVGDRVLTGQVDTLGAVATGEIAELYDMGVNYNPDTTPPSFNSVNIDTITYNSANLNVNSNEDGKVYYQSLVRDATTPTSAEVKANPDGQTNVTANTTSIIPLATLTPITQYDCYVVAEDTVPNLQLEPTKIEFTTLPLIKIGTPYSSIPSGTYTSEKTVPLSCETLGVDIKYTLDGTEPTQSSLLYSSPIVISTSTTIKAKAFKSGGYIDSDILVLEIAIIPVLPTTPTKYIQPPKIIVKENIIMIESRYKIYYTTDGSYPNNTSPQYTAPISIPPNTTTITAIAYSEQNLSFSHITQHTIYPQHTTTIYPPQ